MSGPVDDALARDIGMLRAILSDYQDVISGPDVQRGIDATDSLRDELQRLREALKRCEDPLCPRCKARRVLEALVTAVRVQAEREPGSLDTAIRRALAAADGTPFPVVNDDQLRAMGVPTDADIDPAGGTPPQRVFRRGRYVCGECDYADGHDPLCSASADGTPKDTA